ncbi:hypothetical protein ACJJTC_012580 [Scirpophaga incertulas]
MAPRPPLIPTPVGVAPVGGVVGAVAGVSGGSFAFAAPDEEEAPPSKRTRTEDALEPEAAWLQRHPAIVPIQVSLPLARERAEWRLDGRTLSLSAALAQPVAELKAALQRATGMPTAKQKLHYEGLFFKDTNSLAYYNVPSGALIHLQVKERGGRKK